MTTEERDILHGLTKLFALIMWIAFVILLVGYIITPTEADARKPPALEVACLGSTATQRTYTDPVVDQDVETSAGVTHLYIPCTRTARRCQFVLFADWLPLDIITVRGGRARRRYGADWLCPAPLPGPPVGQMWWPDGEPTFVGPDRVR